MELLKNCPACKSGSIKSFFKSRDYFLSKEEFLVEECNECGLRFTNPRPGFSEILKYYDSADYISHDSSRKGLLTWIYTNARNYMLNKKFNIVSACSKGKHLNNLFYFARREKRLKLITFIIECIDFLLSLFFQI